MNGITERDVLTTETEDLEQQAKRKAGLFDDNEMARKITEGFKQNNRVPSWDLVHMPDSLPILENRPLKHRPVGHVIPARIFRGPGRY